MVSVHLIKLYRILISPVFPPSCRFDPTCSIYTEQAIIKHGVIKGMVLGVYRILRCNPFSKGGYDPVPDSFWRN